MQPAPLYTDSHTPYDLTVVKVQKRVVKDVDFQRRIITIQRNMTRYGLDSTKTGRVRVLPLHPELVDTVFGCCYKKLPDGFVFTFRGKPYKEATIYATAKNAIKGEKLGITPYGLFRHSVLTQAAMRKVDGLSIMAYAGHSSMATTKKYLDMTALNIATVQSMAPVVELFKKEEKKL